MLKNFEIIQLKKNSVTTMSPFGHTFVWISPKWSPWGEGKVAVMERFKLVNVWTVSVRQKKRLL